MTIITITVEAPLWRAGKVRDAISPTLLRSAELTVGEGWSWRTPLTWRFTVTGPAFQVHKLASDVKTTGIVRYPRVAYAAVVLAMLAGPAMAEGNHNRQESAGGSTCCGVGNGKISLDEWKARNRAIFEKNNTWTPVNNWFTRLLDRLSPGPSQQTAPAFRDITGQRGGIINGSDVGFHVEPDTRLARGV